MESSNESFGIMTVPVSNVADAGDNIRDAGDVSDLEASIRAHGLLNPITVRADPDTPGMYSVVAGHRRLAAAIGAGLESVPVRVVEGDVTEIALAENVMRSAMTPFEECLAVKMLADGGMDARRIAGRFGRTLRWALVRVKLAGAGEKVLAKLKRGEIGIGDAQRLADLPDGAFRRELEDAYRLDRYTVDRILGRYHLDLRSAPFDRAKCMKCAKCSGNQGDLFDASENFVCLDPECFAKRTRDAAHAKAEEYRARGVSVTVGDRSEVWQNRVEEYDTEAVAEAEKAGIAKRAVVDPETCSVLEYYDRRDLPSYREESEEERAEREAAERAEAATRKARESLYRKALLGRVGKEMDGKDGASWRTALRVLCQDSDWLRDAARKEWDAEEGWGFDASDIPEGRTLADLADLADAYAGHMADSFSTSDLERVLRAGIGEKALKALEPKRKAVEAEAARIMKKEEEENG